jgi:hypothetical protein
LLQRFQLLQLTKLGFFSSKFEDLNATLGNTQSVANFFRRSVDNSQNTSPFTRRCGSPHFDETRLDMSKEDIVDDKHSTEMAVNVLTEKVEPKTSKPQQKPLNQEHSTGAAASIGSFFRRKMAEMEAQEEQAAKVSKEKSPSPETLVPPPPAMTSVDSVPLASETNRLGMCERDRHG